MIFISSSNSSPGQHTYHPEQAAGIQPIEVSSLGSEETRYQQGFLSWTEYIDHTPSSNRGPHYSNGERPLSSGVI